MTNYILDYYQAIKSGEITVGQNIMRWYEQIVTGLQEKRYTYNAKKASRAIKFIQGFCRHHEGPLAPELIKLELWQKAFLSVVFGILDSTGRRQFREVVLIIARKNGKTLFAAAISAYMLYLDGEYGARVFYCAPKLQQAQLCFNGLYQMIQKEPELSSLSKKRRSDIYVASSNSSAEPLAFNAKKSDGLNPSLAVCDEIASWQGDAGLKQYEVIKSALGARRQPMILSISTAGYINESIYDELIKRCTAVLLGTSKETRLAPFLYMIDDVEKWNDINELQKSNPNLGVSVSVDYLLEEIAVAEGSLSKKAEFITKYCNIKQNASTAWLEAETVNRASSADFSLDDFRDMYCVGGIDLSMTTDLTACCIAIERDDTIYVFTKFFLPREKIDEATARDQLPYSQYITRGQLVPSGENVIDYEDCFSWFRMLVEEYQIYPLKIGYDRFSAQYLVQEMKQYGFHMDDVYQGENLTGVINDTEGLLKDGKIQIGAHADLMKVHLFDSALKINSETNRRRLVKISKNAHVDGMAALLDAMCMRAKYWSEIGEQLANKRG